MKNKNNLEIGQPGTRSFRLVREPGGEWMHPEDRIEQLEKERDDPMMLGNIYFGEIV